MMRRPAAAASLWLIVVASTFASVANGAVTPLLPLYADDVLGVGAVAGGVLVGISPFVAVVTQPLIGRWADRYGYFRIWAWSGVVGIAGILLMLGADGFGTAMVSRTLFGILNSTAATVMAAWVIGIVPAERRGQALARYGVSVWIGLGAGPQLGQLVVDHVGYTGLWISAAALLGAALLLARPLPEPASPGPRTAPPAAAQPRDSSPGAAASAARREWIVASRAVWRPGVVAALAWSAEGVILTFGIVHLHDRGLPLGGITGATSVLTVFAGSVIAVRFLLGSLTDRLGPSRTATSSLILLGLALLGLAFAPGFPAAALAAAGLGMAYAPLYPALTLLADERLEPRLRGTGLGIFGALTALGTAAGTLYGGVLTSVWGTTTAFVSAAVLQLFGLALARRK